MKDQSFAQKIAKVDAQSSEMDRLLKAEGPKYQYGTGCLADGVIGAWMAKIYGVDTPQNAAHIRSTLAAIFKHNFKKNLFDHVSTQRPGYAMGHEPGLLLCSWPRGGKPTLPFFSTAGGFGVLSLKGSQLSVEMVEGELALDHVELTKGKLILSPGVVAKAGKPCVFALRNA